ncbi:hypothetical protein M8494_15805 [Serratia ureilytica]
MLLLSGLFSGYSYASCYGRGIEYAPALFVDLSDKLKVPLTRSGNIRRLQYSGTFPLFRQL